MPSRKSIAVAAAAALVAGETARRGKRAWDAFQSPAHGHLLPPNVESEWIDAPNGHSMHLLRAGSGDLTCVFAHGVMLEARSWAHQLEHLPKRDVAVVAYDHRGHGQSSRPEHDYSIREMADDMAAVISAIEGPVVVFGHSMGGIVAQAFAIYHQELVKERVRGIGLVATISRTPHTMHAGIGRALGVGIVDRIPDEERLFIHPRFGRAAARMAFGKRPDPADVEMVREMISQCELDNWRGALRSLIGFDFAEELAEMKVPVTVFAGTRDSITPIWENRRIARLIPGANMVEYRGCGHMIMLERREEFQEDVEAFVESVSSS